MAQLLPMVFFTVSAMLIFFCESASNTLIPGATRWQQGGSSVRHAAVSSDGLQDAISLLELRGSMRRVTTPLSEDRDIKVHMQAPVQEEPAKQSPQTTWQCMGEDAAHRHCVFKNLYYGIPPGGVSPNFMMLTLEDQPSHGDISFLRADKYEGPWQPGQKTFPGVSAMQEFIDSKTVLEEPDLSVQFNPLFHQNIGHAIFDGLYPAYVAVTALGDRDRKFRPVVSVDAGCFDEQAPGTLQPGQLIETYLPDPKHGRSLRTAHATVKSLPAQSLLEKKRTCNFQRGLDHSGADLGAQGATSQESCCHACSKTFGCESAVLFGGLCYLKGKCPEGNSCSYERDNERMLCTLQGEVSESNITVLVSNSEVSVPHSWVIGQVRRRCMSEGVFETFGRSGEMRRLFEMERDVNQNKNLLVRFEEIIMGVGGAGNMVSDRSGAIGGSQPPTEAMQHFRDRMYAAYDIPVNNKKPKPGDKLNVMVVSNKRFSQGDVKKIESALMETEKKGAAFGEIVDWGRVGKPDTRFRDHLKRVSEADVYVSSIGTALQYVPFMRDGRVYVALGSVWQRSGRQFPTFMEQQLAGAGTPYLRTLYADPGAVLREQKPGEASFLSLGEDGYAASVSGKLLVDLLGKAQSLVRDGFKMPVPAEDNLSEEGRLIVELIQKDPTTGQKMQADRNGANYNCAVLLWNEAIVYEVGPWKEGGGCKVNRKLLRQLRKEHGMFSYGAPEI
mmetsp:Transcript_46302/g.86800  ORF Transcript_46302/g.86800 Transcript_46302/m.86800 type:complete len:726 (+) Transcript_46302:86-2263(+)